MSATDSTISLGSAVCETGEIVDGVPVLSVKLDCTVRPLPTPHTESEEERTLGDSDAMHEHKPGELDRGQKLAGMIG